MKSLGFRGSEDRSEKGDAQQHLGEKIIRTKRKARKKNNTNVKAQQIQRKGEEKARFKGEGVVMDTRNNGRARRTVFHRTIKRQLEPKKSREALWRGFRQRARQRGPAK